MTISRIKTPRTTKGKRQHPQVQRASYPDRPCRPFGKVFGSSRFFCGRSCRPAKRSLFFLQQQCGDRIQEAPHRVRSLTRSNYDHLHIVPGFEGSRIQRFPGTEAPVFSVSRFRCRPAIPGRAGSRSPSARKIRKRHHGQTGAPSQWEGCARHPNRTPRATRKNKAQEGIGKGQAWGARRAITPRGKEHKKRSDLTI